MISHRNEFYKQDNADNDKVGFNFFHFWKIASACGDNTLFKSITFSSRDICHCAHINNAYTECLPMVFTQSKKTVRIFNYCFIYEDKIKSTFFRNIKNHFVVDSVKDHLLAC